MPAPAFTISFLRPNGHTLTESVRGLESARRAAVRGVKGNQGRYWKATLINEDADEVGSYTSRGWVSA